MNGRIPDKLFAVNAQSPASGGSKPVSRLNSVVLPAPLGPMSAVMTPRWISMCSTSTALRPPNVRTMLLPFTIGSGLGAPGSAGTPSSALRASLSSTGIDRNLPSIAEDPLWSEDHEEHEAQSEQDQADEAGLGVGHDEVRDQRVGARVAWPKNEPRPAMRNQKIIEPTTGPKTRAAPPISRAA